MGTFNSNSEITGMRNLSLYCGLYGLGVSENWGHLCGSSHDKEHRISESILGPLFLEAPKKVKF